jgi:RNA polymerase sigma factor (sigma-70 family)
MQIQSTHHSNLCRLNDPRERELAWSEFYGRYQDPILRWILRHGLDSAAADSLRNQIFEKLDRKLLKKAYDPARGRFRAWLKSVVNNAVSDYLRQLRRRPDLRGVGGSVHRSMLESIGDAARPDSQATRHEPTLVSQVIARVKSRVKDTTWRAFEGALIERRPVVEVAKELNISVASVYKNSYRVRDLFIKEFKHVNAADSAS